MLSYLKGAAAAIALAALVACSQSGTPETITLAQVQAQIKSTCNYAPTIASLAAVAATIVSAIDPAAGAAATITVATGNNIVKAVCDAVQAQASTNMAAKKGGSSQGNNLDVIVNGVEVHGEYTPSEQKT